MFQMFEIEEWAETNFGDSDFGDKRLSDRLETTVKKMSARPEGAIPQQMGNWNDTKACYNFLNNRKVTHKRLQNTHRERVKEEASSETVLFIQDTSEADYTNLEATEGLGFIGNHKNKGLLFHSCLAVKPDEKNPEVLGLAYQHVWARPHPSLNKNETRAERNKRSKESDLWLKSLKAIGKPPAGSTWISVGDRANDIFEFFMGAKELGWGSLVRANQDRCIEVDGQETSLMSHMRSLRRMGTKVINIKNGNETTARKIKLKVSWGQVKILPPARLKKTAESLTISVIRCWNDEEGIEWILYSSILVKTFREAIEKIEWYSNRWIIEEYHKCLKTGCRIESSQLETARSLKALLGILGIIGILMLQLRNIAREDSDRPARKVVDKKALDLIRKRFDLPLGINIRVFWHSVARLGGFIGRKSDGEPGWQTLWKGWMILLDMMWALENAGYILAFGAIVYGCTKHAVATGNPGQSEGKEWIMGALYGILFFCRADKSPQYHKSRTYHTYQLPVLSQLQANSSGNGSCTAIVVGNRGMVGVRRVLGSVPDSVVDKAPCAVMIVQTT